MKITSRRLRRIIKEELGQNRRLNEFLPVEIPDVGDIARGEIPGPKDLFGDITGSLSEFLKDQWEEFVGEVTRRSTPRCIQLFKLTGTVNQQCVAKVAIDVLSDPRYQWNVVEDGMEQMLALLGDLAGDSMIMRESAKKVTSRELKKIILEERRRVLKELADGDESEMREFARTRGGKKFADAGGKIMSAGRSIYDIAGDQTGNMGKALYRISEFVSKLGDSLSSINELDEGVSVTMGLPTISELRQLHKDIQRLEK